MNNGKIYLLFTCAAFIILSTTNNDSLAMSRRYTAKAIIRVLPYADKDPMTLETPTIDIDIQNRFQNSMAKLIKQPSTLRELLKRDKIRDTEWFMNFGKMEWGTENEISIGKAISEAIRDLNQNLRVSVEENSDFIIISMTCDTGVDSAIIANEVVDLFIKQHGGAQEENIMGKMIVFREQSEIIRNELSAIQKNLEALYAKSGFTDLSEEIFPHPARIRLNRLQRVYDECVLEITQLKAEIELLKKETKETSGAKELRNAQRKLTIQQRRLEQLDKMLDEAKEMKRQFDYSRIQYKDLLIQKERIIQSLRKLDMAILKLSLMLRDPAISKLQIVEQASVPTKADIPAEKTEN